MTERDESKIRFHGIIPPLVTPFDQRGEVDAPALRAVVRYVLHGGVHGVFVAGSTGEAYAMTDVQRLRALEVVIEEVNGRVPVFAGTARITTEDTIALTRAAESAGADAVSIVTPYFITPSQEELYDHYRSTAKATSLPVILYNNPGRTGVVINPQTTRRLGEIDNIVGMKDSSGNMGNMVETIRLCGPEFRLFCGFDTLIFTTLAAGGAGAVPASANIAPRLIVDLYEHFRAGRLGESRDLQAALAPLRNAFSLGTFPAVLKEGLDLLGVPVGSPKLPVKPLEPEARESLRTILNGLSLKPFRT
jgi:4-hydroxy-tetrahydrodipicolinate synthase